MGYVLPPLWRTAGRDHLRRVGGHCAAGDPLADVEDGAALEHAGGEEIAAATRTATDREQVQRGRSAARELLATLLLQLVASGARGLLGDLVGGGSVASSARPSRMSCSYAARFATSSSHSPTMAPK